MQIRVKDGRIEDLRFNGHGCAISQASASIASEELMGMELEEVGELDADWAIDLLGIPVSATRRKCALLGLKVVRAPSPATTAGRERRRVRAIARDSCDRLDTIPSPEHRIHKGSPMATLDRTKIAKPSPIVEDEQGQLLARQGISREVVRELSKVKGEPDWMAEKRVKSLEIYERKPCRRGART